MLKKNYKTTQSLPAFYSVLFLKRIKDWKTESLSIIGQKTQQIEGFRVKASDKENHIQTAGTDTRKCRKINRE